MRDLSGPETIRQGLLIRAVPSRNEAAYWSRAGTGREAEIRPYHHPGGGWVIEFTQDGAPQRAVLVETDGDAHEVAQEYMATGWMPGGPDGSSVPEGARGGSGSHKREKKEP